MAFIEFIDVKKKYRLNKHEIDALKGINLKINKGEFVTVVGPSGAGKSTLLNLLGAIDTPTEGKIIVDGKEVSKMNDKQASYFRMEMVGFVFQSFNLLQQLTAEENVALPLIFSGWKKRKALQQARKTLGFLGLEERARHKPSELSGGEAQRVAIARAIVTQPQIILADEPTGNLDSKTGRSIINILKELNRKGHTVVLVTHERSFSKYGTRTIQILDGKIIGDERHF